MDQKGSNNLCNTYILPLVGCNKQSFGLNNLVNSFVADNNVNVVVHLRQISPAIMSLKCYRFHFERGGEVFTVFEVPHQLRDTIILFREGKYSQFSTLAKEAIRTANKRAGMNYRTPAPTPTDKDRVVTSRELTALDKGENLRKLLESELQVKIDRDAELASIPGEECFFALNINKPVELVS